MRRRLFVLLVALITLFGVTPPVGANPGDLSDEDFVAQQYEDFLTRAPDAGGLAFWTAQLQAGVEPAALIEFMVNSPEFQLSVAPMVRLYYAHFRRSPDFDGLQFWTSRMAQGTTLAAVSENFALSPEFQTRYGSLSDGEYVDLVYLNVLGRPAEPAGRAFWLGQLANGTSRGAMMSLFSEGPEFKGQTDGLVKATMLYVGLFHREPDDNGLNFWAERLDQGDDYRQVMTGFLNSPEYQSRLASQFGAVHPLTGERTNEPTNVPALALKIDNSPRARPQIGLNQADLVYEELVEGRITRFIAIFQSRVPAQVGPIRSIRTGDFDVLAQFNNALFGASGGNSQVLERLAGENVVNVNALVAGNAYFRVGGRSAPHNLVTSPAALRNFANGRGGVPAQLFSYRLAGSPLPAVARPTKGVAIDYGSSTASYVWDPRLRGWVRSQNGTIHVDSNGRPIAPDNVVVQITNYGISAADGESPEAVTVGSGEVLVFTNGSLIQGTWSRAQATDPIVFKDTNGNVIKLTTGTTWVSLAPVGSVTIRN